MKEGFKSWIIKAGIRAIKTFAQTLLGFVAVGLAINEIPWGYALSVSAVALIASLLTSLAGLPELKSVESDGRLVLDMENHMTNIEFDDDPIGVDKVTLDVVQKTGADGDPE